jgi:hypothetical protein
LIAEKLQAVASPWTDWVNDLELRHVANEGGLTKVLQWDTKRGRDFQCLAQFIYCCDGLPNHLIPTHQKMERWLTRMDSPAQSFRVAINGVLDDFYYIATDKRLSSGFTKINKKLAPVEFVFIGSSGVSTPWVQFFMEVFTQVSCSIRCDMQQTKIVLGPFIICVLMCGKSTLTCETHPVAQHKWKRLSTFTPSCSNI